MELFSEIYGCYYDLVAQVLRQAPLSRRQIESLVAEEGYGESTLELVPKLLTDGAWRLLEERDGLYTSRLSGAPELPVTALERAWLKALLGEPRVRLFLTDGQLGHLSEALQDTEPLWWPQDFVFFDRCLDGDSYENEGYRRRFQAILEALREQKPLYLRYQPQRGNAQGGNHIPLRLEYSAKDDKFRVYTARVWEGKLRGYYSLNLGRILELGPSGETYRGPVDVEGYRRARRCAEPVVLRLTRERNAVERFMVEFSSYEKRSEYDEETGTCTVRLWYQKDDETEVLIRILGFGPVLRVLGPPAFLEQVRGRVRRQAALQKQNSQQGDMHENSAPE